MATIECGKPGFSPEASNVLHITRKRGGPKLHTPSRAEKSSRRKPRNQLHLAIPNPAPPPIPPRSRPSIPHHENGWSCEREIPDTAIARASTLRRLAAQRPRRREQPIDRVWHLRMPRASVSWDPHCPGRNGKASPWGVAVLTRWLTARWGGFRRRDYRL